MMKKTNEMLNNYVTTHKLGESGQNEFIDSFIASLGLELDGRLVILHSGNFNHKIRATKERFAEFICNQLMSNGWGLYKGFTEDFSIIEIEQPKPANTNFFKALADGQKIVEESEKWEGI